MASAAVQKLKLILQSQGLATFDVQVASEANLGPREFWPAPSCPEGVPRGVVVELLGTARTEWLLAFLKQNSDLQIFWAERETRILPTAIQQRGVDLGRVSFGVFAHDLLIPLRKVLQSQCFEVVVAPNVWADTKIFKAFQLFAEKSQSTLFLMGEREACASWAISLQIEIEHAHAELGEPSNPGDFSLKVLRRKYGALV